MDKSKRSGSLAEMNVSVTAGNAMVVTPHHLATQTAIMILRQGGSAIEAMVAAAATISVVYPHMNTIGGDAFWLIVPPSGKPFAIDSCGPAGSLANLDFFNGYKKIPIRGPKSAITVAGAVAGWGEALRYASECGIQKLSVEKLLEDAIKYAEDGFPVSSSQAFTNEFYNEKRKNFTKEFNDIYYPDNKVLSTNDFLYQKKLAQTLKVLANDGLDSFYRGNLAKLIAEDMKELGMPITESDLNNYTATRREPLTLKHSHGELYNLPPPTQGVLSLSILGMLDELHIDGKNEGEFVHAAIEATKQAFRIRDEYITDPKYMTVDAQTLLSKQNISKMASFISMDKSYHDVEGAGPGDTVWMGIMDDKGYSVSFIQSIYHEYGSGVVLPKTGILWQNRGVSFKLDKGSIRSLVPGKKPFHTLNPAAALLNDGRVMVYGSRGGDVQPQTQTAIFHRYVVQGKNLQEAIYDPRWSYGPLTMDPVSIVRLESRFSNETIQYLLSRGHKIKMQDEFSEIFGQAGAIVRHPNGILEGGWDVRSNGFAAGF